MPRRPRNWPPQQHDGRPLRYAAPDARFEPQRRLRAPAVLARDDAPVAGPARPAAPGRRSMSSWSAVATRGSPRPASSPAAAHRSASSRPRPWASAARRATAASSIPATSGDRESSSSATARRPGRELFRETLDAYALVKALIADEAIDCEFRECGYIDLAYAPSHVDAPRQGGREPRRVRCRGDVRAPRAAARGDRVGRVSRRARRPVERAAPSGQVLRRAGRGRGARRRRSPRRRPGADDPPPGRRPARRRDGSRRDPREGRRRRDERLHGRARPVAAPPDHPDRQLHHRHGAAARRISPARSRRRAGRSSTPRTSCTTGTSRPTAG